ncbi:hypothetical protein AXF42_Ash016939 [Apostasia shenzhenica]|uniref:Uncharacterized protein n=1 Tax=Apostasia shenzhenica TaxID=1088818 RepID=A0A2H9ZRJ7_9ASPA|nr:hypothetical protein AXF42_Ash016939 [Apostasia shenzhenica]
MREEREGSSRETTISRRKKGESFFFFCRRRRGAKRCCSFARRCRHLAREQRASNKTTSRTYTEEALYISYIVNPNSRIIRTPVVLYLGWLRAKEWSPTAPESHRRGRKPDTRNPTQRTHLWCDPASLVSHVGLTSGPSEWPQR